MEDDATKPVIDYAAALPGRRPAVSSVIGGAVGILLAAFGILMLVEGIQGALTVMDGDFIHAVGGMSTLSDCFAVFMFLVIGAFSGFIAWIWIRGLLWHRDPEVHRKL